MNNKLIALILGLLCFALSVFGIFQATNCDFYKIPVFGILLDDADIENTHKSFEEAVDSLDEVPDEEIEDFESKTGVKWSKVEACLKNPSINRLIAIGASLGEYDSSLDLDESLEICKIFRIVIIVYGLIVALFSLLGALFKKKVFPIIAIVLSLAYYLLFVGALYLILFIALSIAHIVFISKTKKALQVDCVQ